MIWVWRLLPDESLQQRGRARLLRLGPFNWLGRVTRDSIGGVFELPQLFSSS